MLCASACCRSCRTKYIRQVGKQADLHEFDDQSLATGEGEREIQYTTKNKSKFHGHSGSLFLRQMLRVTKPRLVPVHTT